MTGLNLVIKVTIKSHRDGGRVVVIEIICHGIEGVFYTKKTGENIYAFIYDCPCMVNIELVGINDSGGQQIC